MSAWDRHGAAYRAPKAAHSVARGIHAEAAAIRADRLDRDPSSGIFEHWQRVYAERGIVTVPCSPGKKPLVGNPHRFGAKASKEIVDRFPDASALGFYAGRRNGLTVLDVDTTDERVLRDALDHHGTTPLLVRTASGKWHAYYHHNGECRRIRPWRREGLPIDIVGAGLCIAPPSELATGTYQIIEGRLDDLDRLPIMRGLDGQFYSRNRVTPSPASGSAKRWSEMHDGDGRNDALFRRLGREAHHCDDFEQLLDRAQTLNTEFAEPMEQCEVSKVSSSVWKMTVERRNHFGQHGSWLPTAQVDELVADPYTLALLSYLKAHNGPDRRFWVADGLRLQPELRWSRRAFKNAREHLVELGWIIPLNRPSPENPVEYRWGE
jgi:hypothetical protein